MNPDQTAPSEALAVLKQYTYINSRHKLLKWCRSRSAGFCSSQLIRIYTVFYTTCEFMIITRFVNLFGKQVNRKFLACPE